jgi:hypothetical protein
MSNVLLPILLVFAIYFLPQMLAGVMFLPSQRKKKQQHNAPDGQTTHPSYHVDRMSGV